MRVGVATGDGRPIRVAGVLPGSGAHLPRGVGDPDPDAEDVRGARRCHHGGLGLGDEREPERQAQDSSRTYPESAVHGQDFDMLPAETCRET
jgi:hypothetical protein